MAYRVVLVDDEPWTIVYLKKLFKWSEMGFEVIAETKNSVEALDIIVRTKPDVVFTDIRMPKLSGLELMYSSREKGVFCEFVIISGFADFSYAQQAIQYGIFEYCLKPLDSEKADQLLERLFSHLSKKAKDDSRLHSLSQETRGLSDDHIDEAVNEKIEKIKKYIKINLHKKLKLSDISKEFYFHPNYCCYLFNKVLGTTFSKYLTELRMQEAEKLLHDKRLTTEDISKKCGYDDYFYFNKVFKKIYGVTPYEYRKSL